MADLLIKEAELQQLQGIIEQVPTKFGVPLLNFFNAVTNLRAQEAQEPKGGLNPDLKQPTPVSESESLN